MTELLAVLNVTPDSFSDGGRYMTPDAAIAHVEELIDSGAQIIDVGAESTRPGATPLNADEEWQRLEMLLPEIILHAHSRDCKVSLDTRHSKSAAAAIRLGVDWINDVSSAEDPDMLPLIAESGVAYVVMHHLGIPANPERILPASSHPVEEVMAFFQSMIRRCEQHHIAKEQLIIDPGIGFGKNATQSLQLLWDAPKLRSLGCPVLIGHSRKSFLQLFSPDRSVRDPLTLCVSSYLIHQQIDYLRIHDMRVHATLLNCLQQNSAA